MTKFTALSALGFVAAIAACTAGQDSTSASDDDLRGISKTEAEAELAAVGDAITAYYGPIDFKTARFGFNLKAELAAAKVKIRAGQTEGDRVRPIYELLAKLHDGHISYQYPMPANESAENDLPMLVTPFEDKYVVDLIRPNPTIARGDILVSIDGKTPEQMAQELAPLTGDGNPESEKLFVASQMTFRPFYAPTDLIPTAATAKVVVQKPDGTTVSMDMPWNKTPGGLAGAATNASADPSAHASTGAASAMHPLGRGALFSTHANFLRQKKAAILTGTPAQAGLGSFGELAPFWLTQQSVGALAGIKKTEPKPETLVAMGVAPAAPTAAPADADAGASTAPAAPPKYLNLAAFKYPYEGKTILVVRIPSFEAPQSDDPNEDTYSENVGWLAALLKDNMAAPSAANAADPPADVVVLDDTENPGGAAYYALGLASLFATQPIPSLVQAMHADRKWLGDYSGTLQNLASYPEYASVEESRMRTVETAYDANKTLSDFIPLSGDYVGPQAALSPDTLLGGTMLAPYPSVSWSKPVLILHDQLSGSCGDIFPDLLQNAGVAKTFGVRSMGLGGSVEPVLTQTHSGAILSLTRGMGGPFNPAGAPKLIENEGVTPDFEHPVTVADFRAGYVDYVKSFSHLAATITR
jgi:hypothetical protein